MTTIDRDISSDFMKRVPTIEFVTPPPGKPYYALIRAEYVTDGAKRFGPDHHILVDLWDEQGVRMLGVPVNFTYPDDPPVIVETNKVGVPYAVDHALFNHGYVVGCWAGTDRAASDYVQGMGLGKIGSEFFDEHVTYYLIYRKMIADATAPPESPVEPGMTARAALEKAQLLIDIALEQVP